MDGGRSRVFAPVFINFDRIINSLGYQTEQIKGFSADGIRFSFHRTDQCACDRGCDTENLRFRARFLFGERENFYIFLTPGRPPEGRRRGIIRVFLLLFPLPPWSRIPISFL